MICHLLKQVERATLPVVIADRSIATHEDHVALLPFAGVEEVLRIPPLVKAVTMLLSGWPSEQQYHRSAPRWTDSTLT
jgi:hypothetical protein